MRFIILFFICIFISSTAFSQAMWYDEIDKEITKKTEDQIVQENRVIKIVGFGDSLMSGYHLDQGRDFASTMERKLWANQYRNVKIYPKGVSGETTADALNRLDSIIALKPDIVMLEFGINDVFRKVPLQTIYQNLNTIVKKLKENDIDVFLIGMQAPPQSGDQYGNKFFSMYQYIAKDHQLYYYPFFLKGVVGIAELNLSDGVHPNQQGVETMVDNVYPYLEKVIRLEME